jgi:hypothetical protein
LGFLLAAVFRLVIRRKVEEEKKEERKAEGADEEKEDDNEKGDEEEDEDEEVKTTYLDLLPREAVCLVASYLTPTEVLDGLLPAAPSRFSDLRSGVNWARLDDRNPLELLRHLVFASSDEVAVMRINYKPVVGRFFTKWQRIVATGRKLKTLVIQDPELVRGQRLSLTVEELQFDMARRSERPDRKRYEVHAI